jgi:hypothetical protein
MVSAEPMMAITIESTFLEEKIRLKETESPAMHIFHQPSKRSYSSISGITISLMIIHSSISSPEVFGRL